MRIQIIEDEDQKKFSDKVNLFLELKQEFIHHEKTLFSVIGGATYYGRTVTLYTAIFYGEF